MRTINKVVHKRQIERINRIALHLFAAIGYEKASMEQIAKACGIKKASLYHYYPSKEAILHELIRSHIATMQSQAALIKISGRGLEEILRSIGMKIIRDFDNPDSRDFIQLLMQDSGTNAYTRKAFFSLAARTMKEAGHAVRPDCLPLLNKAPGGKAHMRTMYQYLGSIFRFAVESKLWKAGPACGFSDREYVNSLSRIFASGIKALVVALLAVPLAAAAADSPTLTMDSYLAQVVEKSPALESARQARKGMDLKPLEIAMIYSPLFNAGYTFVDSQAESTSFFSPDRTKATNWQLGLTKKWFTGTTTMLTYGMNSTRLFFPAVPAAMASFLPPSTSYDAKPTLTVSQSLLRDFMGGITDWGIAKVKHASKSGERMTAYGEQATMMQAEMTFWQLALARATVEFKKKSLERTVKIKDWTERRVRLNLADQADLLQINAALQLRALDLRMSEEDAEATARRFNSARGMDGAEVAEQLPELNARIDEAGTPPEKSGERLDVQAAKESLASAEAAAKETFYRSLPDLSVFGSLTENGHDITASEAHAKAMQGDWPAWTVGATLTAPLDLITLAKVRKGYDSDFEGAKASYRKSELEAKQDWEALKNRWNYVKARLELAREVARLQEERMIGEQKRLENGRILTFQYLTAQDDFDSAQLTYLRLGLEKISVEAQARMFNAAYGPR
jgi:outer membrane protein TolC